MNLPEGVLIYCLDGNRDAWTGESEIINPVAGDPGVGNPQTGHGGLAVRSVRVRHIGKVLHKLRAGSVRLDRECRPEPGPARQLDVGAADGVDARIPLAVDTSIGGFPRTYAGDFDFGCGVADGRFFA